MNTVLPGWGWILVAMALYLFYASNRSSRLRKEHRQERLKERQEQLMEMLKKKTNVEEQQNNDKISDNESESS
jgi:hypothetical protein